MKRLFIVMLIVMLAGLGAGNAAAQSKQKKEKKEKKPKKMKVNKKIDINFATVEELQNLSGIDAETAQAIIDNRPYQTRKELNEILALDKNEFAMLQRQIVVRQSTINFARLEELQALPGIDEDTAQAIIDGRPFDATEDLLGVDGIDEDILKGLDGFIQVRVNINGATPADLQKLPGVDTEIALAIIQGSPYKSVDELILIDGIDESVLADLQDFIEVRMNINDASLEDLQTLPGVTPEIAGAIIERREERPYEKVEELLEIDGVDESVLAGLQKLIEAKPPNERGRKLPGQGR